MKNIIKYIKMKNITLLAVLVLFAFNINALKAQSTAEKQITITYKGMTVSDNFKFEDSKGNSIVFHDEDESFESKLTLWDEGLVGKRFKVTYKWVDVILFDASGIETGETMKVKRIFNYSLQ
tara:strand:- start:4774 stop:5139 length:366 start_codon:yes stop_codon:yes gene_type:complete